MAAGTVFRHFPTKADLLRALMKDLLEQVTAEAATLAEQGDPARALFDFFADRSMWANEARTTLQSIANSFRSWK